MSTNQTGAPAQIAIDGVSVEIERAGEGRQVLFLHGMDGVDPAAPWFASLAQSHEVIAPWHPGFGHSQRPAEFRTVADLAYFYLELIRALDLRDLVLVGSSFGGWLAAEIAVRSTERISAIGLVSPLGIKVGGRLDRGIVDMHALSQEQLLELMWHDAGKGAVDYSQMSDHELLGIARSREAFTFYGWKPYMNNRGLRRWLRRIRVPSLVVWGESDGVLTPEYRSDFVQQLPDARSASIAEAGHYPHLEQPERFTALLEDFLLETSTPAQAA